MLGNLTIKRKLVLIIMLVSITAVLAAGSVFVLFQWIEFRQRMVRDLSTQAAMLADNCTGALSFDDAQDAYDVLNSLKAKQPIVMACFYRKDGSLLALYRRNGLDESVTLPPHKNVGHHFYSDHLEMFHTVRLKGQVLGSVFLYSDLSELSAFLHQNILAMILMMLFISVAAYALSAKLQQLVSTPIVHLAAVARNVTQNRDYSLRAVKSSRDELGQLTDAFNSMLGQIEQRDSTLRTLRNLLSNIINSMPSVLVGVDRDGHVTQWNREAELFSGISAAEAQGHSLAEVFPRLAVEMENATLAIKESRPRKSSKIASDIDGEICYSDITVYPLMNDGVDGAVIRIDDVTDQVRIEEMMIQSEKMLSVGGLAAGMAHEINNPLAGILQNIQVLRNRISTTIPRNDIVARECGISMESIELYMTKRGIFEMVEAIIQSGRRAAKIVDNMLSFSRKGASRFTPCLLSELLDKTVELASNDYDLKKKYDFRRIIIRREYEENLAPVWCESSKIQQVLFNLLKNGAEAMTDKVVGLTNHPDYQPQFTFRLKTDGDMQRLEVEDNGLGMDETIRKRIFEPFFTTKDVGLGTGLGLSVSYFIITENHGGTLNVESEPGKGTAFIIRLPMDGNHDDSKG